jgi:hypothetical protein
MDKLYLIIVYDDVEPDLIGYYGSDDERLEDARAHRLQDPDMKDGLFRLDISPEGHPTINPFSGDEFWFLKE